MATVASMMRIDVELDDRGIRLSVVHPMNLSAAFGDDTCLGARVLECKDVHTRKNVHI